MAYVRTWDIYRFLGTISYALLPVVFLGMMSPGYARSSEDEKPGLANLLDLYNQLGLPLPPKEAPLIRFEQGGGGFWDGVMHKNPDQLAFMIKPGTNTEMPTVLWGIQTHQLDPVIKPKWSVVQPTKKDTDGADSAMSGLALAIQCHARGWDELANLQYERSKGESQAWASSELLHQAWSFWSGKLIEVGSDRSEISKRLKNIIERDNSFAQRPNVALIRSLDLALVPSKAKPGSIEALIDGLIDFSGTTGRAIGGGREDPYQRVAIRGFEAVPALIDHLYDDRLTRGTLIGFNNFRSFHLRVKHVVSDLLEGLAGQGVEFNWLRRQQGYTVPEVGIRAWWVSAQKEGEEPFLMKHFLDVDDPSDGGRGDRIRQHRLLILIAKYPKRIPELYKTILARNHPNVTWAIARALHDANVPKEVKIETYLFALQTNDLRRHTSALQGLELLDGRQFSETLVRSIEKLPTGSDEAYGFGPISSIARMATHCDDPRIWETLAKAARRATPGLRMEMLYRAAIGYEPVRARNRTALLAFLSMFLDDNELSDSSKDRNIQMPFSNYGYPVLEIRNGVTTGMGQLLQLDVGVDTNRKPEEWAILRARVREAWKQEQAKGAAKESGQAK